jgi:hypothetical protein
VDLGALAAVIRLSSGIPRRPLFVLALACALGELVGVRRAHAQSAEPVRIEYSAPPECPARSDFLLQLASRAQRVRLAAPGELARSFTVSVRAEGGRFVGRLGAERLSETAQREIAAASCDSVVASLALAVALALDPDLPEPPSEAATANSSPAPPQRTTRAQRSAAPGRPTLLAETSPRRAPWRGTGGVQVLGVTGVMPGFHVAPRIFGELLRRNDGAWAPSFRLSFVRGQTGSVDAGRGTASFTWLAARAEACVHRFELRDDTHFSPCAFIDAGAVRGVGAGVTVPRDKTLPWVAPGALVRLDQELFQTLALEVQGGLFIPLDRGDYHFDPDPIIFETPAIGGEAALGIGVRFP